MIRRWNGVRMAGELGSAAGPTYVHADEIITEALNDVIDSDSFTPRLLHLISNALVWRESRLLRQAFNLGTNDWRVIAALSDPPRSDIERDLRVRRDEQGRSSPRASTR